MKRLLITLGFIVIIFSTGYATVFAHQPYLIGKESTVTVVDPEVSKAYYAELNGSPAVYTLTSDKPFELYANILVPDIVGITKDFSAVIRAKDGKEIVKIDGEHFQWEHWYEDFAGDWYWKGPEFKQTIPAGTYTITVSNPTNSGKYVLAPGEAEVFTLGGTPHTIKEIYSVKTKFFGKPGYAVFEGIIGKAMLGILVFILLIIILGWYVVHRRRQKIRAIL